MNNDGGALLLLMMAGQGTTVGADLATGKVLVSIDTTNGGFFDLAVRAIIASGVGGAAIQAALSDSANEISWAYDAGSGTMVPSLDLTVTGAIQVLINASITAEGHPSVTGSALVNALANSSTVTWALDGNLKMVATAVGGGGSVTAATVAAVMQAGVRTTLAIDPSSGLLVVDTDPVQNDLVTLDFTNTYHATVPTHWAGQMKLSLYDASGFQAGFGVCVSELTHICDGHHRWRLANSTVRMELSNSGTLTVNGSFVSSSDARVKTSIQDANRAVLQAIFDAAEPRIYKRTDMNDDRLDMDGTTIPGGEAEWRLGFVSQEIRDAVSNAGAPFTNLIQDGSDGLLKLDYSRLTCILWGCCKNLQNDLQTAAGLIADLTARVENLEGT